MLVVPDASEIRILTQLMERWNTNGTEIGLFDSNHTPVATDVLADFEAIEADFPGYERETAGPWDNIGPDGAGRARIEVDNVAVFTRIANGSPATMFGYFVTDLETDELLYAELFAVPFVIDDETADPILVKARFTLRSEPP